jgi:hypothetical protein
MDSLEDNHVSGRILHTMRSNAFMMLIIGSVAVLMLAGMVLSAKRGRGGPEFADQTWTVNESMDSELQHNPVYETSAENKFQQLSDVGYSPEAARAILESEDILRNR